MNKSSQKISKRVLVALTFVVLTVFAVIVWEAAESYTEHVMGVSALPSVIMFSDGKSTIYIRETNGEPIATLHIENICPDLDCGDVFDGRDGNHYYIPTVNRHHDRKNLFRGKNFPSLSDDEKFNILDQSGNVIMTMLVGYDHPPRGKDDGMMKMFASADGFNHVIKMYLEPKEFLVEALKPRS